MRSPSSTNKNLSALFIAGALVIAMLVKLAMQGSASTNQLASTGQAIMRLYFVAGLLILIPITILALKYREKAKPTKKSNLPQNNGSKTKED